MFVVYRNKNDNNELYYGNLLTDPELVHENTLYVDVEPLGDLKTSTLDYKKLHIQSVNIEDVKYMCYDKKTIKRNNPEAFI